MENATPVLVSINAAASSRLKVGRRLVTTGHFKRPITGPVLIAAVGVPGDFIGNVRHHGGPDQAIYLYSMEDVAWWERLLQRRLGPGFFAENLSITNWWTKPRIGDRVAVGDVLLEITAPRTPCATLEARVGMPGFLRTFIKAERSGAYARVLRPGIVRSGDPIVVTPAPVAWPTVAEVFRYWYGLGTDESLLLRMLEAPLAERVRERVVRRLADFSPV
ncbi:MOSC domain-containing protein YiiM [Halopseudomonas xinjiangensis]|uniref:MOSC domain-containing protein YiiM n=1 Tax=Halopseudomonas xinjiangensis TaxID=487184 RepID=A0A1H1W8N0_9GAMM|nr:MOSC domain-containing protein [Halopseudomonas xinjiangensis]SDS92796.1 MOSC domain-containing protein YiiM [Halopseudomonas xinjiangensis]